MDQEYRFDGRGSSVHIGYDLPSLGAVLELFSPLGGVILVCDVHTESLARRVMGEREGALLVLPPGEDAKEWVSVERILAEARRAGLGRDGLFIGIGGGVVGDLTAFAASVYMRGGRLCLIPTTLLGMVDAALGGKTGFDLLGVKNLVGTFYPADHIFMSIAALASLPGREWKSGMAELIKTAVLDTGGMFKLLESLGGVSFFQGHPDSGVILELIARSTAVKGRIVQADPRETGTERALLNLGHTFGHALESAVGLGVLSHGEAVAWGMVRACELGLVRGITPPDRAAEIAGLIGSFGYETAAPHPLLKDAGAFFDALGADKKKKGGKLTLVVPAAQGAVLLPDFSLEDAGIAGLVNGDHGV